MGVGGVFRTAGVARGSLGRPRAARARDGAVIRRLRCFRGDCRLSNLVEGRMARSQDGARSGGYRITRRAAALPTDGVEMRASSQDGTWPGGHRITRSSLRLCVINVSVWMEEKMGRGRIEIGE